MATGDARQSDRKDTKITLINFVQNEEIGGSDLIKPQCLPGD